MDTTVPNLKPIIEIKDLMKSYGENHVLNGFNMVLYEGENLVIMGKSGSGKSVMIKCLIGLEEHDRGSIQVMGKDISELDREELDELRTEVGFLFQGSALYDSMTVRENLEFPLRRHTKKFGVLKDTTPLVLEALENVGLAHTINLMPEELSGGMKRRLGIEVLLLDGTDDFVDERLIFENQQVRIKDARILRTHGFRDVPLHIRDLQAGLHKGTLQAIHLFMHAVL